MYGSLINRMMENNDYTNGNVKVGTYVTEYLYTDRNAYVITKVEDEKHFTMADENGYHTNVVKRGNRWYKEHTFSKKLLMERAKENLYNRGRGAFKTIESAYGYLLFISGMTDSQLKRLEEGKEVKTYRKINISIGINDPYFDMSF